MRISILVSVLFVTFISSVVSAAEQAPAVKEQSLLQIVTQLEAKRLAHSAELFTLQFSEQPTVAIRELVADLSQVVRDYQEAVKFEIDQVRITWALNSIDHALDRVHLVHEENQKLLEAMDRILELGLEANEGLREDLKK